MSQPDQLRPATFTASFEAASLPRAALVMDYVSCLPPAELEIASSHAETLFEQGGLLRRFSVLTPIAAHQEHPDLIHHSIQQYAQQQNRDAYSFVFYGNYPKSFRGHEMIATSRNAVMQAAAHYPGMDIRYIEQAYPSGAPIGRVRRDLWNAALALAARRYETTGHEELFGINQDIDLVRLSPHYLRSILLSQVAHSSAIALTSLDDWAAGASMPMYARSRHAFDPRFPNTSHVVMWDEMGRHQTGNYFETGAVASFTHYALHGGINRYARIGEVNQLMKKGHNWTPNPLVTEEHGKVFSETSIRRYVERLHAHDLADVWSPHSFTQFNRYREHDNELHDISFERMEELVSLNWPRVRANLLAPVDALIADGPYDTVTAEEVHGRTDRELALAQNVAARALGLTDLATAIAAERAYLPRVLAARYHRAQKNA